MKFIQHFEIQQGESELAVDFLAEQTGLSKVSVKDCLNKGAVWLKIPRKKELRLRRAKYLLRERDRLSIYYDERILKRDIPVPECICKGEHYSIWNKPPNLLSQGTRFGDHCSLLRIVEKYLTASSKTPHLLHRLDREACGLVVIAHSRKAAAALSALFRQGQVYKRYGAVAHGLLSVPGETILVEKPLDNKAAATEITIVGHDKTLNRSKLDINLITGRYHQIRRHLKELGHPLVGDNRYGSGRERGEDTSGLLLQSYLLSFCCPFSGKEQTYRLTSVHPEMAFSF